MQLDKNILDIIQYSIVNNEDIVGFYDRNRNETSGILEKYKIVNLYNGSGYIKDLTNKSNVYFISINGIKNLDIPETQPELVDLGLPSGTLWMKYNMGAESETDFGKYYQWGDIMGYYENGCANLHSVWETTPFNNEQEDFNKTYFKNLKDKVCHNGILAPEYDAVTVTYGEGYRMPTEAECQELCTLTNEQATVNGVKGRLFHGKGSGEGNTLFIPFSGFAYQGNLDNIGSVSYLWSSSLNSDYPSSARCLHCGGDCADIYGSYRRLGYSIRGVCKNSI